MYGFILLSGKSFIYLNIISKKSANFMINGQEKSVNMVVGGNPEIL